MLDVLFTNLCLTLLFRKSKGKKRSTQKKQEFSHIVTNIGTNIVTTINLYHKIQNYNEPGSIKKSNRKIKAKAEAKGKTYSKKNKKTD